MAKYNAFCRVAETGNFTTAAVQLGYSQSAVSQMIRSLEEELGVVLFARGKNGAKLTADGELFLPYIKAICAARTALEQKKLEVQGLQNSEIRIGTFTSISRNLLPKLMGRFSQLHPGVRFSLQQGDYATMENMVLEGDVDFGFTNTKAAGSLQLSPLYRDHMVAVLPVGHPLASEKEISLEQLAREPLILLEEGGYSVTLSAFARCGLQPRIRYTVEDDYTVMSMVSQGLGCSVLYRVVVSGYRQDVKVLPIREPVERVIAMAWKDWDTMPHAARTFVEYIREETPSLIREFPGLTALN